jgi:hypothetical protein
MIIEIIPEKKPVYNCHYMFMCVFVVFFKVCDIITFRVFRTMRARMFKYDWIKWLCCIALWLLYF